MKARNTQKGFTMILIILSIVITFLIFIPFYLDRIKSAEETKERAKVQVEEVERRVEKQARDFEKQMQDDLNSALE